MSASGPAARVVAQAKVNLHLRLLAREASGFHQLETLFCRLALGDDVTVRTHPAGTAASASTLDCRGADTGPVERNLAWRAALAYQAAAGWPAAFAIEIEKHIPVGGGLGGGSADAGAVLRVLDALAPRPLGPAALLRLAMPLGSDVPFLTAEAPLAWAWGRGERLMTLPALPERRVVLGTFAEGVATAEAYAWVAAAGLGARPPESTIVPVAELRSWPSVAARAENDFERVVFAHAGRVAAAFGALAASRGATLVRMSGSGATVFRVDDGVMPLAELAAATAAASPACRLVATRSATSVVPVERLD